MQKGMKKNDVEIGDKKRLRGDSSGKDKKRKEEEEKKKNEVQPIAVALQDLLLVRVFYHEPVINSLPRIFYTSLFVMVPTIIPQKIEIQFL